MRPELADSRLLQIVEDAIAPAAFRPEIGLAAIAAELGVTIDELTPELAEAVALGACLIARPPLWLAA
jgi:hypothetical protein